MNAAGYYVRYLYLGEWYEQVADYPSREAAQAAVAKLNKAGFMITSIRPHGGRAYGACLVERRQANG